MDPHLQAVLLDLEGLSDEEAQTRTFQAYLDSYTDYDTRAGRRGERTTHDDQDVVFYEDRFDHAFFTTFDKVGRAFNKGAFDRARASRVRWIGEIVAGRIRGTSCWLVYQGMATKRLYVHWDERYVVWLEPTARGKWKFSTAYTTDRGYIRKKTRQGKCIWSKK